MTEFKKTVNVSLQSKRYRETINKIIAVWNEDNKNKSTEICESILLREKINRSPTLLKVLNAYELVEKLLKLSNQTSSEENIENMIDEVLSQMIEIHTEKINLTTKKELEEIPSNSTGITNYSNQKEEIKSKEILEYKSTKENSNFSNELKLQNPITSNEQIEEVSDFVSIPDDFLYND